MYTAGACTPGEGKRLQVSINIEAVTIIHAVRLTLTQSENGMFFTFPPNDKDSEKQCLLKV